MRMGKHHLHKSGKPFRAKSIHQTLDISLALGIGERVILQASNDFVRRPAQDVVRLVTQLLRNEREQVLVCITRLL